MLTGIIIVSVIVAFALYDYYSTKNWQLVTSDSRNDTVFENRNKKYGAYQIRRDYNRRMILIMLGISGGIGGLYAASFGFSVIRPEKPKTTVVSTFIEPTEDDKDDEPVEDKKEEPKQDQEQGSPSLRFVPFTFTSDPVKMDTISVPTGEIPVDTTSGKGTDPFGDPGNGNGTGGGGGEIKDDKFDNSGIAVVVDEPAHYIGGDEAQNKFLRRYANPPEEGTGTTRIKFVVSKDGSISKAWVKSKAVDCPECDAEALRLVKSMPKWEPGKINGTPVDSYFTIPITFR